MHDPIHLQRAYPTCVHADVSAADMNYLAAKSREWRL